MKRSDETTDNLKNVESEWVASPNRGKSEGDRIAIQGYEGSFHQMAARHFYGKNVQVIPCDSFKEVIKLAGNRKESDGGAMAIENSIAGSILANYNLLQRSSLVIVGEVYLQIKQNLLVNRGVTLEDIREIHSHPMAIQQCFDFFRMEPVQIHLHAAQGQDTYHSFTHAQRRALRGIHQAVRCVWPPNQPPKAATVGRCVGNPPLCPAHG